MGATLEELARFIERQRKTHGQRCRLLLARQENARAARSGYKALAMLLGAGYFSVVVTTNTNNQLERALGECNVRYEVLVVGRDADDRVVLALDGQETGIFIVKLLANKRIQFAAEVQASLQSYLRSSIAVVGSINGAHRAIVHALTEGGHENRIYYVVPTLPPDDTLLERMQRQYRYYDNFLICGPEGDFSTFFCNLAARLSDTNTRPVNSDETSMDSLPASEDVSIFEELDGEDVSILEESDGEDVSILEELEYERSPSIAVPQRKTREEPGIYLGSEYDTEGALRIDSGPLSIELVENPENSVRYTISRLPLPGNVDVLIATATDIELETVRDLNPQRVRRVIQGKTYYDLGYRGRVRVVAVQANNMGPMDAHATVDEGIRVLAPRAVIMVGIAFGIRSKGQEIGDILISKLIHEYDLERVGTAENDQPANYQRGLRIPASEWLVDRFIAASHERKAPPAIHFGAILSGSKLVDNQKYQDNLLRIVQDAIGGEMEGMGLAKAANRHKVDWLLVKGISDWGDGKKGANKDVNQRLAAGNAAELVFSVIEQDDFMQDR